MCPGHKLTDEDRGNLTQVLQRCDTVRTVSQLVDAFAGIANDRHGHQIDDWIAQVKTSSIAPLRGFADGPLKDYDAVRYGLTLPWNSAAVGGTVTRTKALKPQGYGRAAFDPQTTDPPSQ